MPQNTINIFDTHFHIWDPSAGAYTFLTDQHKKINRYFGVDDIRPSLEKFSVSKTILVQTWHSIDESKTYLNYAQKTDFIRGVVGWVDLTSRDVSDQIKDLKQSVGGSNLVSIRHLVHDEDDPKWLLRSDVLKGLQIVCKENLAFDLLIREREIPSAIILAQKIPELRLIVDHIAKPRIIEKDFDNWHYFLSKLANTRKNIWCKISGITTEASWTSTDDDQFSGYIGAVIKMFGSDRCLYGSDWPVCLLAGRYERGLNILQKEISCLKPFEQKNVFEMNAFRAYNLSRETE